MPRDLFTDLRVIDVGGARATYKIQNKGSVLSAYRKNITQDQTPKAQQQEQNRGMEKNVDGRRETRAKAPTPKHQQRRTILSKYLWLIKNAKAKCLKQNNLFWFTHTKYTLTLRGLSTYVGAVATLEGSLMAVEGFACCCCCCCSSSVLRGSRKNSVKTEIHGSNADSMLQSQEILTSGSAPSPVKLIKLMCLSCLVEAPQAR